MTRIVTIFLAAAALFAAVSAQGLAMGTLIAEDLRDGDALAAPARFALPLFLGRAFDSPAAVYGPASDNLLAALSVALWFRQLIRADFGVPAGLFLLAMLSGSAIVLTPATSGEGYAAPMLGFSLVCLGASGVIREPVRTHFILAIGLSLLVLCGPPYAFLVLFLAPATLLSLQMSRGDWLAALRGSALATLYLPLACLGAQLFVAWVFLADSTMTIASLLAIPDWPQSRTLGEMSSAIVPLAIAAPLLVGGVARTATAGSPFTLPWLAIAGALLTAFAIDRTFSFPAILFLSGPLSVWAAVLMARRSRGRGFAVLLAVIGAAGGVVGGKLVVDGDSLWDSSAVNGAVGSERFQPAGWGVAPCDLTRAEPWRS